MNEPESLIDTQLLTLLGHAAVPVGIKNAVGKSPGAQFYRCAFQVNPFGYLGRHAKPTTFSSETAYNIAIVDACQRENVRVVGLTDHFRISTTRALMEALRAVDIHVFPGFEASSSEGVHLLCLFPHNTTFEELERVIGRCGVSDVTAESPLSDKNCDKLIELVGSCGGVTIAAHVCSANGLLTTIKGQSCIRSWCSDHLLAVALPGPARDAPEAHRAILLNKDPNYKRARPPAVINANDVSSPEAFSNLSTTTLVKMSDLSVEGLRQAFLDPESRIRLNSDEPPPPHTEILAIAWAGGLLDGQGVRLNESLNVLIGGRGAGKSTVIESVRYAFDLPPKADEARRTHDSIIKSQLGQGASVGILIRSPHPSLQYYVVERIYGSKPRVRDHNGEFLDGIFPKDILGNIEVYGQHEISELTRQPAKLAELLRRFTEPASELPDGKIDIQDSLQKSRTSIIAETDEIERIEEALAALPTLRERLKRFAAVGLDARLKEKTLIDTEARILESAAEDVEAAMQVALEVRAPLGDGSTRLDSTEHAELPNLLMLQELNTIQTALAGRMERAARYVDFAASAARDAISAVRNNWTPKKEEADQKYTQILRDLKTEGHDGSEFVSIQGQVERLRPKEVDRSSRMERLLALRSTRRELLVTWESAKASDFRSLQQAARRVSKRLEGRVRVTVRRSKQLTQIETTIRKFISGNINQALEQLKSRSELSLVDFAEAVRNGPVQLVSEYGFSEIGAKKFAQAGSTLVLELEECEIAAEALLELNVGTDEAQTWKQLDDLSAGQKATAVLLLLLLESTAPLIVDQPEDDLDNRFIAESIVPAMRQEKRRRQFVFSSHNANIPVLGDAEQIVGLTPVADGGVSSVVIPANLCGSIDVPAVKELVKELLEGGEVAFEYRRKKYGF